MNHVLKCHSEHFEKVWQHKKLFEIRINDRTPGFAEGDTVFLQEWDQRIGRDLPRWIAARVSCVILGDGVVMTEGYCVFGLEGLMCYFGDWSKSSRVVEIKVQSSTRARGVA